MKNKNTTKKSSKKSKTPVRAAWRRIGCQTCKAKVNASCVSVRGGQVGEERKPHTTRLARVS